MIAPRAPVLAKLNPRSSLAITTARSSPRCERSDAPLAAAHLDLHDHPSERRGKCDTMKLLLPRGQFLGDACMPSNVARFEQLMYLCIGIGI
jgi:hypothetical protein